MNPTDDARALEPCPFCGGKAIEHVFCDGRCFLCKACRAEGPPAYSSRLDQATASNRAASLWNRRAQSPNPQQGADAIVKYFNKKWGAQPLQPEMIEHIIAVARTGTNPQQLPGVEQVGALVREALSSFSECPAAYKAISENTAQAIVALYPKAAERAGDGGWQPIGTAPRDGTRVHLGFAHMAGFDVIGHSYGKGWQSNGGPNETEEFSFFGRPDPTHWQPLPSPPSPEVK